MLDGWLGYLRPDEFLDEDNNHEYHDYHYQGTPNSNYVIPGPALTLENVNFSSVQLGDQHW